MIKSPRSHQIATWLVFASDICGLVIGFNLAFLLRFGSFYDVSKSPLAYGIIFIYLVGLYLTDSYRLNSRFSNFWLSERVLLSILSTVAAITSLIYLTGLWGSSPLVGRGILLITVSFFSLWAIAFRTIAYKWVTAHQKQRRFLILGDSPKIADLKQEYQDNFTGSEFVLLQKQSGFSSSINSVSLKANELDAAVGTTSLEPKTIARKRSNFTTDNLDNFEFWSRQIWSGVLISSMNRDLAPIPVREIMNMRLRGTYIYSFADFYEQFWQKIPPSCIEDDWFAFSSGFSILHNHLNVKLKQTLDYLIALSLLVLTFPIVLLCAISIKLDSPGSIFYSQTRTGLNGLSFKVYKFRSMYTDAEIRGAQWAQEKDPRITRVGNLLRITRLDELPQLWNVLKGEMSLIGPRPERPEFDVELRQAIPYYDLRYLVKPGITGWAQVSYSYGASVKDSYQKVAYDLYYIKNYSLVLDAAIALKTLRVIFLGKGR